jgi:SAM-dependent methyltransferase
MSLADWETFYRWEWFSRDRWRGGFREAKRGKFGGSCACVKELADEFGASARVLDASCGLGLKTIVLSEMGVDISGSDGCAFAVDKARELARLEGCDIEHFVSTWAELPTRAPRRFDVIFNDALSWTVPREEFEASLAGFLGALSPSGVLVFMGAEEGGSADPVHRHKLLDELWCRRGRFEIDWTHEAEGLRCTRIALRELGADFMDEHGLYLIDERGRQRLEVATIRQPVTWHWPLLAEMFASAGFASLHTRTFPGRSASGGPIRLNVATK